jgi:hypothetical protein
MQRAAKKDANHQEIVQYCNEYFKYDDGCLFWKKKVCKKSVIGNKVGTFRKSKGYFYTKINKRNYPIHQLVFLIHFGYIPECTDHIDGDPLNNKIENLRPASSSQNNYNRGKTKANTSGYKGVFVRDRLNPYSVRIVANKKRYNLGSYSCIHYAARVYNTAARFYHGEFSYTNEVDKCICQECL